MGVHDFTCFIENNGQCFNGFIPYVKGMTINEEIEEYEAESISDFFDFDENEIEGAFCAYVITIPGIILEHEIREMGIKKLCRYRAIKRKYDWDMWDFPDYFGYDKYPGKSIWYRNGNTNINVGVNAYRAFFLGNISPCQIPLVWYKETLENYDVDITEVMNNNTTKTDLYNMIVEFTKKS